jgi:hypothetical protein
MRLETSKSTKEIRDCAIELGLTLQDCYDFDMIIHQVTAGESVSSVGGVEPGMLAVIAGN